ncbi:MAG: FADH(2)-oxidizing methylenetetrahydrofolate--tRNA-(uracil(54)-C(5))-methyltransferase TrmFO [Aquificaceae bacterium]|nr:FADH(2)-oxidizing methylenetetrahydrofolate--tRNA-(uracil(54)-C(5))-methyltransferase TrmFO [Aquificaceae bacterium]
MVVVIGGGLAGAEASLQLSARGIKVTLYEMRPNSMTPAHKTSNLAELVCSNTFGSIEISTGAGLLKKELEMLSCKLLEVAEEFSIPAGSALAVDRELFSQKITKLIEQNPLIELRREEIKSIPRDKIVIVATGPLTSEALQRDIELLVNKEHLYFYDAISPIVDASSVDYSKGFWGSRYSKGNGDYFNCTLNREEYETFYKELLNSEQTPLKDFEKAVFFEGCMPIEELAKRGPKTLLFGPMKPVGLKDPNTDKRPYAILQLRRENIHGTLLSLVGFQTRMTYSEQKRVLRLIPCLRNAIFVKLGSMHRNTFLQSNKVLTPFLNLRTHEKIFFAGQITGAEGYTNALATGLMCAINVSRILKGLEPTIPPAETMLGAMIRYITTKEGTLQPIAPVMGLLPPLENPPKDRLERNSMLAERALKSLKGWLSNV